MRTRPTSWWLKAFSFFILFAFVFARPANAQFVIIGTDAATLGSFDGNPIDDFYNFSHYQTVYLASELSAQGMSPGSSITALGFSVVEDNGPAFPTYTIRLGNTAATNSAAHDVSALTPVFGPASYDAVVTTAGSHNMITLSTPFVWNGSSNILVDICTGSSSMAFASPYGKVRSAAVTNGSRFIRADGGGTLCATSTNTTVALRPQIRFNYTPGTSCSSTPAGGQAVASVATGCGTVASSTLSVTGSTSASGLT